VESLTLVHSNIRVLVIPTNIRLRWRWIDVANALAYYNTPTITAMKSFIVQTPENEPNKLECLSQAGLSNLVLRFQARLGACII
jgi:hypothetical protein